MCSNKEEGQDENNSEGFFIFFYVCINILIFVAVALVCWLPVSGLSPIHQSCGNSSYTAVVSLKVEYGGERLLETMAETNAKKDLSTLFSLLTVVLVFNCINISWSCICSCLWPCTTTFVSRLVFSLAHIVTLMIVVIIPLAIVVVKSCKSTDEIGTDLISSIDKIFDQNFTINNTITRNTTFTFSDIDNYFYGGSLEHKDIIKFEFGCCEGKIIDYKSLNDSSKIVCVKMTSSFSCGLKRFSGNDLTVVQADLQNLNSCMLSADDLPPHGNDYIDIIRGRLNKYRPILLAPVMVLMILEAIFTTFLLYPIMRDCLRACIKRIKSCPLPNLIFLYTFREAARGCINGLVSAYTSVVFFISEKGKLSSAFLKKGATKFVSVIKRLLTASSNDSFKLDQSDAIKNTKV